MISLGTNFYPGVYDTYNMGMFELFLNTAGVLAFVSLLLLMKKVSLFGAKYNLTLDEVVASYSSILVIVALMIGAGYFKLSANNTLPQVEGTVSSIGETTKAHGPHSLLDKETEVTLDDGTKFSVLSSIDKEDFSLPAGTRALFECDGDKLERVEKCIFVKTIEH